MNYLITDVEIKSLADAIRSKTNIKDGLSFPQGFIEAIYSIPNVDTDDVSIYTCVFSNDSDKPVMYHGLGVIPDFIYVKGNGWEESTFGNNILDMNDTTFTLNKNVFRGEKIIVISFKSDMLKG